MRAGVQLFSTAAQLVTTGRQDRLSALLTPG